MQDGATAKPGHPVGREAGPGVHARIMRPVFAHDSGLAAGPASPTEDRRGSPAPRLGWNEKTDHQVGFRYFRRQFGA